MFYDARACTTFAQDSLDCFHDSRAFRCRTISLSWRLPPAIVHLEAIAADGKPINAGDTIRIPVAHKRVTFTYTGLSLAVPQRVRFRYFLDGFDRNWSEPTAARKRSIPTSIPPVPVPGRCLQQRRAVEWLRGGSFLPSRSSVLADLVVHDLGCDDRRACGPHVLTLRVLSLTRQMNIRLEERVGERTRIARELHDSLLQVFRA